MGIDRVGVPGSTIKTAKIASVIASFTLSNISKVIITHMCTTYLICLLPWMQCNLADKFYILIVEAEVHRTGTYVHTTF